MKMLKIVMALIGLLAARSHAITVNPANAVTGDSAATAFTLVYRDANAGFSMANVDATSSTVSGYFAVATASFTVTNGIFSAPSQPAVDAPAATSNIKASFVDTQIFFTTPNFDPQNMWAGVTSSGTFRVPIRGGGKYNVTCSASMQIAGTHTILIYKNGSAFAANALDATANTNTSVVTRLMQLSPNDTIQCFMSQSGVTDSNALAGTSGFISIIKDS